MTVTLELKPEIEAWVTEQAAARGLTVEAYLESVVEILAAELLATSGDESQTQGRARLSRGQAARAFTPRIISNAAPPKDRSREHAWLAAHRSEYADQWVALDGDRLLGHGLSLKEVADAAHAAGVKDGLIARVEPSGAPPYVGV
jgi:inactivated superfamily I helicase